MAYFQGPKSEGGEHSFLSKTLGRNKVLRMESQMDNTLMPPETVKQEGQSGRPFFDEWPKSRDSWSGLEDERSDHTQLSISIPMSASNFSTASSHSPHDEI
ncbi:Growth-regulating factor 3 [Glycine soja]